MSRAQPIAPRVAPPTGAPAVRIDRIVVRGTGDAATGERLKRELPAVLNRVLTGLGAADERAVRRQVERAVREASR